MSETGASHETALAQVETLHGCPVDSSRGQRTLHVPRERLVDVTKALWAEGFEVCVDLTGVDYSLVSSRALPDGIAAERFEVVVNLLSISRAERLRLRVQVPESDPVVPSLFDVHPGTEAHERETFDMFGISFDGHPDMTRILMPEDWVGHPLRKDFSEGRIPVQFKGANA
ncbi:MAG: NADH-quinone oxidoreductase subunit C [Ilumatobacteraceae bacterium]